ncbi:glutamate receptor ionotropic, kainate 3-like isoform X3 [Varroa jacobsoni]|uniref:glutamate receptor ionotropic, kainate 3-like isoform X3 n=1 Tax=Varroa jacobsoni TaxID=62625 RepID=UPI000BF97A6E|nr:glutamate receptor ionotropic, kainate 3-like isoform X3 [Varroa jacobsoni]
MGYRSGSRHLAGVTTLSVLFLCGWMNTTGAVPARVHKDVGTIGIIVEDQDLAKHFLYIASKLVDSNLKAVSKVIQNDDILEAIQSMCALMESDVNVVFGPTSPVSSLHVSSMARHFDLPHIEFRWDPSLIDDEHSLNLFPDPVQIAEAQTALMEYWKWRDIALIYESDDDIIEMRRLLQELQEDGITVNYFKKDKGETFRTLLRQIKERDIRNVVVDLEQKAEREKDKEGKIESFLKQAMQVAMLNENYNYFFLSLDFHVAKLNDFMHSRANITALRLVDMKHHIADDLLRGQDSPQDNKKGSASGRHNQQKAAMARARRDRNDRRLLKRDEHNGEADEEEEADEDASFPPGLERTFEGATGRVNFNEKGIREDFVLFVTELGTDGLEEIGIWSKSSGLNITNDENEFELSKEEKTKIDDIHLRIVTVMIPPWIMKDEKLSTEDRPRYKGFLIDLLEDMKKRSPRPLDYELYTSPDGSYGVETRYENGTITWNGMIGELVKELHIDGTPLLLESNENQLPAPASVNRCHKANVAIADLIVSDERLRAVDFTLPFMTAQLVAVVKAPVPRKPGGVWSFFLPLTREVWMYTVVAGLLTALIMYMCARFCLSEYVNTGDGVNGPAEEVDNQLGIVSCLLFVFTTLLHQRMHLDPNATATRVLAGFWYFFTFVILAIIVGNLCESVLYEDEDFSKLETIQGLLRIRGMKFTCIEHGATCRTLMTSHAPVLWEINKRMFKDETPKVKNMTHALAKISQDEHLAFIMEYASAKYLVASSCDLVMTKPFANHASYGIALNKKNPGKTNRLLSEIVLNLQAKGILQEREERWWKTKRFCDVDNDGDFDDVDDGDDDSINEQKVELRTLSPGDLSGAFILLFLGLCFALLINIGEVVVEHLTREKRDTYFNMITVVDHIRFAFKMQTNQVDLSETSLPRNHWKDQLQKRRENRTRENGQKSNDPTSPRKTDSLSSKIPQYQ